MHIFSWHICSYIQPVRVFNHTGTRYWIRQRCLILKSLCIRFFFMNQMILCLYVLCTLPMYHLSTHDHNLYTFAQSTVFVHMQVLYVTYDFFFIHVHVPDFCQKTMKKRHLLPKDPMCMCVFELSWVLRFLYSFFFFQCVGNHKAENLGVHSSQHTDLLRYGMGSG